MKRDTSLHDAMTKYYRVTAALVYLPIVMLMFVIFHIAYLRFQTSTVSVIGMFVILMVICAAMYSWFIQSLAL